MKNLKLFALGLIGAGSMMMTSCEEDTEEDVAPILTVTASTDDTNAMSEAITVAPGEMITFEWDARAGDNDLDEFEIFIDGTEISLDSTMEGNEIPYEDFSSGDQDLYNDGIMRMAPMDEGTMEYTFEVTDAGGLSDSHTITVTVEGETTELTAAQDFTWFREGNTRQGLDEFGLEWQSNSGGSAIIVTDANTTMIMLEPADWTDITTVEGVVAEFAEAIDQGTTIQQYTEIATDQSATYDDVLGIYLADEDQYYLLHVTQATVDAPTSQGTPITVTGEYKTEP